MQRAEALDRAGGVWRLLEIEAEDAGTPRTRGTPEFGLFR